MGSCRRTRHLTSPGNEVGKWALVRMLAESNECLTTHPRVHSDTGGDGFLIDDADDRGRTNRSLPCFERTQPLDGKEVKKTKTNGERDELKKGGIF